MTAFQITKKERLRHLKAKRAILNQNLGKTFYPPLKQRFAPLLVSVARTSKFSFFPLLSVSSGLRSDQNLRNRLWHHRKREDLFLCSITCRRPLVAFSQLLVYSISGKKIQVGHNAKKRILTNNCQKKL